MKTKEFIRRLSIFAGTYGMRVSQSDDYNYITLETDDSLKLEVLCVETKAYFSVNSIEIAFDELPHLAKQEVMNDIIFPYISTPLEKRVEEKKYRYEFLIHITAKNVETKHICRNHTFRESGESDQLIIDLSSIDCVVKDESFHFTDKEVEQFTGKDRALFNVCEKIEVTP